MSAQSDFHYSIDRAANSIVDAACTCRAAGAQGLPAPHRRLVGVAIVALDKAQQALFTARNDPWQQTPPKSQQLELL